MVWQNAKILTLHGIWQQSTTLKKNKNAAGEKHVYIHGDWIEHLEGWGVLHKGEALHTNFQKKRNKHTNEESISMLAR